MSGLRSSLLVLTIAVSFAYLFSEQLSSYIPENIQDQWKSLVSNHIQNFFKDEKEKSTKNDEEVLNQNNRNKENQEEIDKNQSNVKPDSEKPRIFTKTELWKNYRGEASSKGLYLAFFGRVYDVSEGKQYYAPGGGYDFFAGRDGTKGFVTGDFSEAGLTDDLEGLDPSLFTGFLEWIDFYEKTYKFVGYLVGNFYDEEGNPTAALRSAEKMIAEAEEEKDRRKVEQRKYPFCNSESSSGKARVWCSKRSGGIERDWVGVPRRFHLPGKSFRCACIRNTGPPSDGPDPGTNRGDLDNPNIEEYPGCRPDSPSCNM